MKILFINSSFFSAVELYLSMIYHIISVHI